MILICIPLMANDIEYLFMYLLAILLSSLVKCLCKFFAYFLLFVFLFLGLNILYISGCKSSAGSVI